MRKKERILIAGAGAVVPMAVSFLAIDARNILDDLTLGLVIGLGLRALVLFSLGAITGLLNRQVTDRKTLFQLGIAAPALIGGLIMSAPTGNDSKSEGPAAPMSSAPSELMAPAVSATPALTTPMAYITKAPQPMDQLFDTDDDASSRVVAAVPHPPPPPTPIMLPFTRYEETSGGAETLRWANAEPYVVVSASAAGGTTQVLAAEHFMPHLVSTELDNNSLKKNIGRGFFGR